MPLPQLPDANSTSRKVCLSNSYCHYLDRAPLNGRGLKFTGPVVLTTTKASSSLLFLPPGVFLSNPLSTTRMIILKHKPHEDFVCKPLEVPIILRMKSKICILASKALCDLAYLCILTLTVASHSLSQLYSTSLSSPKAPSSLSNLQAFAHAVFSA